MVVYWCGVDRLKEAKKPGFSIIWFCKCPSDCANAIREVYLHLWRVTDIFTWLDVDAGDSKAQIPNRLCDLWRKETNHCPDIQQLCGKGEQLCTNNEIIQWLGKPKEMIGATAKNLTGW